MAKRAGIARFALASAVAAVMGTAVQAGIVTWVSPSDGLWAQEPFRWSSNPSIPGIGDDVVIDVPNATILVTIKGSVQSINSLFSNEGIFIDSGGLSVAANSTINGMFTLSAGSVSGSGNLTLNGTSSWLNNTTMDGTGKTIVSSTGTMSILPGLFNKTLHRTLDNFGVISFDGNGAFATINMGSAAINNKAGATFTIDNSQDAFFYGESGNNALNNDGTFVKTGTGTATFGGGGSTPVALVNSGQMNVQAGTIILQTGATHSGHFSISSGATLRFDSANTFTATSDLSGAGNLFFFNSTGTNQSDGTVNIGGSVTVAGATNIFNKAFTAGSLLVPNGAAFTFNGTTTLGVLTATNLILGGSGDVSLSGDSTWTGFGTMSGSGRTIVTPGSTFNFESAAAAKNIQRRFENNGTVNWNGVGALANLNFSDGTFSNKAGATFNVNGDQYSFVGTGGSNAFLNVGLLNKTGTGTASFTGSGTSIVSFVNSGTTIVSAGLLQFDASLVNSGTVSLSGGTMTLNAGLSNTGAINVTGGVLNLGGTIATVQLGNWSNSGGQVNLLGTLNNASSTLALNDTTGQLRMLAGSQIVGGALSTLGSSRLKIVGAATLDGITLSGAVNVFQLTNLTVLHGLTLSGAPLTLDAAGNSLVTFQGSQTIGGTGQISTAGGTGTAATLGVSAGDTLTIAPGITVHPGTRDIVLGAGNATVINQGTLLVDTLGSKLTVSGTSVQNLGTFQAQNGGTLVVNGPLTNLSGGTLTGGTWRVTSNGTIQVPGGPINTNASVLVLDGAGSNIMSGAAGTNDALANLSQNAAGGDLSILNGRTLSTTGDFLNNGTLTVGIGSGLTTPTMFTHNGVMTTSGVISTGTTVVDGSFTLSGGTHTVSTDFTLGSLKNNAEYDLNAGTLSVGGFGTIGAGPSGAGVFNQAGGNFSVGKQLYISTAGTNTSTYNISGGVLTSGEMLVGFFGGAQGIVNQSGGSVTLAGNPANSTTGVLTLGFSSLPTTAGTYNLTNGTLTDQGVQIGFAGSGTFNHSGGTHTVNGALDVGMFTDATATYSMSNGASLNVAMDEVVGPYGNGIFNQTGGVNNITGSLIVGQNAGAFGTFNLSGGTLTAAVVHLVRGKFNATGGAMNVSNFVEDGGEVTGTLQGQSIFSYIGGQFSGRLINSGTVALFVDFTAGNGLDNRSSFDVAANRTVTLNGAGFSGNGTTTLSGTLTASVERIGESGDGAFTQSAGANNVAGNFSLGYGAGRSGTYTMQGGTLAVSGTSYVGFDGNGSFVQSAGSHTAAVLILGADAGSSGNYGLSNTASLNIAGNETIGLGGNGTFNQTGGTHTVGGTMSLGLNPGSSGTYNLSGGTLTAGGIKLVNGAFNPTGGTLNYASFVQSGGDVSGTLANATTYTFNGGTFSGRLINSGTVVVNADLTLGNGLSNHADFSVAANRVVTLGGAGLTNDGTFELAGSLSSASAKIGRNADGTFTQSSGTHAVSANLYVGYGAGHAGTYALQGGTLNVAGNTYIGFDGGGTFTHSSGTHTTSTLFIAANAGSTGNYNLSGGNLVAATTTNNGTFTQTGGTASLGSVSGTGAVSVSGGTLAAASMRQNSLSLANNAVVNLAVGGAASAVKSLSISSGSGNTNALNIGNNTLLVDYTGASVLGQIQSLVASGYGPTGPHWTGPGIRSSSAASDPTLGIGVMEASDLLHISGTQTATFQGQTVDASTVLLRVTKLGDANLDGQVNFGDFQRFEIGYGQAGVGWLGGDFNNDGMVNDADFALLYANYGSTLSGPPLPVSSVEMQAMGVFAAGVPEPASVGALMLAGAASMLRRSRRRR